MEKPPLSSLRENKLILIRHSGEELWRKSRLEGRLGKHLQVGWPLSEGRLLPFEEGSRVEVGFSHENHFYVFSVPILQKSRRPLPLLVVPRPVEEELLTFRRRTSSRVTALMPLSYSVEGAPGRDHSLILSLSATGIAFNTPHPITPKSRLQMEIHLPGATASLSAEGEVVACGRVPQTQMERYKIRVRFLYANRTVQDRIVQFVREKKRNMEDNGME
jgi:c-di-GMP-binding flagellar brake protein YcgR